MTYTKHLKAGFAAAAITVALGTTALSAPSAFAAPSSQAASNGKVIVLSIGRGQQINLPQTAADVVVADPAIADLQIISGRQFYVLAKGPGETTIYATDAAGRNIYTATIRVGSNLDSLDQMLGLAMPDADIQITTMNGAVLLTGTVANPEDAEEAQRLVQAFAGSGTTVISRLKNATPLQVNLRVRIAEVSRSLAKEINGNLATRDNSNGFLFGVQRNSGFIDIGDIDVSSLPRLDASSQFGLPAGSLSLPFNPQTGQFVTGGSQYTFNNVDGGNALQAAGRLFGFDVGAAFELSERAGLLSTLAEPNLTTVSGETAEFRAGGQFPIPVQAGLGSTGVEFRNYGVSLTYTPTVLSNGRISLRVRPEVSDVSSQNSVRIAGFEVPSINSRMADTTVELGSGQSFMIAGLLQNTLSSSVDKMPGAGDIPILGALFKSNGWRKNETELMIIVTPYLVKPVSDNEIVLPTDGFNSPNDIERVLLGKLSGKKDDTGRPAPTVKEQSNGPDLGSVSEAMPPLPQKAPEGKTQASVPGFSFE
ncbi:type II and III secretion system protein family protein [Sphingorhabdus arenilitoris]|uniref:Type II and III secretion system protein family protein n=1 Tax=Sphingorhabdus arenilitoris TaxID=1490041 RepID=A0ABV8RGX2_9SPHN